MQDLFCHGTEDIPVFLAVQSLNKGTDLRESAAGVDRRVHAVAVKSQQGQIDLAELLAQVFCKTAVRKRTAPESVIVENTAVELCRGGVLADIVDPEFRVQIADGQKFSRKRTIGFIGVQVNPVDKVHFLENDRRIAGILDIIQNFRIVERRQMEPENAVRILNGITLFRPLLALQQLVVELLLNINQVLFAPELGKENRIVNPFRAADQRRLDQRRSLHFLEIAAA